MRMRRLLVAVVVGVALGVARAEEDAVAGGNAIDSNTLEVEPVDKNLQEKCSSVNPMTCLKLALAKGLDRLSRWPPSLEVFPGLTVRGDMTPLQDFSGPPPGAQPEDALLRGLGRYLSSLSLTVRVLDGSVMQRMQELGERLSQEPEEVNMARKKRYGGPLMLAGLMSGGTMLALGMAAIAAMAGKAMMAALLSLMMSAMASMKGGGDKGGSYEVIHAHEHKHRSLDSEGDHSFNYPSFAVPPAHNRRSVLMPYIRRRRFV